MRKVAIIQNRLQRGGRLQVLVHIIRILNEMNIVPELITLKSRLKPGEVQAAYGIDVQYRIREVLMDIRLPFEWHILFFNRIVGRYLRKYHLVINSNNTSFGLPWDINTLSYVHFPRKMRNISPKRNIHFPEGADKSLWDFRLDPFRLASAFYKRNAHISPNDLQVANSAFTREMLVKHHRIKPELVEVVPPPVDVSGIKPLDKKPGTVVSLGRFAPDKRQLEQIQLASRLPDLHFHIIGFVNEPQYFAQCKDFVEQHGLNNVTLMPDLPIEKRSRVLAESEFFLHSLRNEPFGITTVQAIAAGCIPIVHDSGGQKEVVPNDRLRYADEASAADVFGYLAELHAKQRQEIQQELMLHIGQYDAAVFKNKMKPILLEKLNRL